MKSVTIHAALLAAALLAAFFTWTANDAPEADAGLVEIWDHDPAQLEQLTYRAPGRTLTIERHDPAGGTRLWGTETVQQPATPATDSATAAAGGGSAPQVEEYPLGQQGDELVESLARLRVLRDLGEPDQEERSAFGLDSVADTLTLRFRGAEPRVLAVGGDVVGGGHRYVLDAQAGRVYVLPSELIQQLALSGSLRRTQINDFQADDVRRVVVRTDGTERVMAREATAGAPSWLAPGSAQPDQAFANFMTQLDGLWVSRYRPDVGVDTLQAIVRVDYLGARGDTLGTVELFRTRAAAAGAYYVRTNATVVPAEAYAPLAERIEQDVRTLFTDATRRTAAAAALPRIRGTRSSG